MAAWRRASFGGDSQGFVSGFGHNGLSTRLRPGMVCRGKGADSLGSAMLDPDAATLRRSQDDALCRGPMPAGATIHLYRSIEGGPSGTMMTWDVKGFGRYS